MKRPRGFDTPAARDLTGVTNQALSFELSTSTEGYPVTTRRKNVNTSLTTSPEQASLPAMSAATLEMAVIAGDLSKLTPAQRVEFYGGVCHSLGLNPLTRPFLYVTLNNALTLYATKNATDQIRANHRVNVQITSREVVNDVYVVTARAVTPDGRMDESIGAVTIAGLRGEALANAYMKGETKAKRRVTLSLIGLGVLDELEIESIKDARIVQVDDAGELIPIGESPAISGPAKPSKQKAAAAPTATKAAVEKAEIATTPQPRYLPQPVDDEEFKRRQLQVRTAREANGLTTEEVGKLCYDNFYHGSIRQMLPVDLDRLVDALIPGAGLDKKAHAAEAHASDIQDAEFEEIPPGAAGPVAGVA
jgi:hypothetical protein